eukprot:1740500-Rhodomonas_salina.1
MCGTDLAYAAPIRLCTPYAMSGTDLAEPSQSQRSISSRVTGTSPPYLPMCALCMCDTELGYAAVYVRFCTFVNVMSMFAIIAFTVFITLDLPSTLTLGPRPWSSPLLYSTRY